MKYRALRPTLRFPSFWRALRHETGRVRGPRVRNASRHLSLALYVVAPSHGATEIKGFIGFPGSREAKGRAGFVEFTGFAGLAGFGSLARFTGFAGFLHCAVYGFPSG